MSKKNQTLGPTPAIVDASAKALAKLIDSVAPGAKPLTAIERRRLLKIKKGGVDTGRALVELAQKYGVDAFGTTGNMLESFDLVARVQPLAQQAKLLSTLLNDIVLRANGTGWKAAVNTYVALQGIAASDTSVAADLAPIASKFSTRAARKRTEAAKAEGAKAGTATPATPTTKGP